MPCPKPQCPFNYAQMYRSAATRTQACRRLTLNYTQQIDQRLRRIAELLPDCATRRIDTVDLNEEKTRLYDLRNSLGLILATLKDSLCLDVREDRFEDSAKRLVAAIRAERV